MSNISPDTQSIIKRERPVPAKRNLQKVPFVELFNGRVQGVVSSGSDDSRVYVSWIEGSTGDFYCATNNNRPCGGLRGGGCKHIEEMIGHAISQYGGWETARHLGLEGEPSEFKRTYDITSRLRGSARKEQASEVFARFLNYLRYMELNDVYEPVPEMAFFITA